MCGYRPPYEDANPLLAKEGPGVVEAWVTTPYPLLNEEGS
jgi:hypothetical protein